MASEFKIPLHRFDTNLLPPDARQVGTESFKTAVMLHFAVEYAAQGQTALVTVDDKEIMVMAFPAEASALDFVLPMLQSGRIAEALPYQAELENPFGKSRITRAVMYYTDSAVRTMLRTEVSAEFYNAPQRYALGADENAFTDDAGNPVPAWQVMLGRLLTLTRDEDGNLPQVGQFPQQSMQPNIEQLRSIAMMFAGETSLPVGSLGIVQDNPESAEAIRARNEELGIEIEHWQRTTLGPAWKRLAQKALAIGDDSPAALAAYRTIRPQWGSWAQSSEVSQAQASLARVQAVPRLAETDVELEHMGYTRDEIERIQAQWARASSRSNIAALTSKALADAQETPVTQAV